MVKTTNNKRRPKAKTIKTRKKFYRELEEFMGTKLRPQKK
jgi:hypothetical protein